jgi:pimeloyl-ACP methyl ester carboxylesterase
MATPFFQLGPLAAVVADLCRVHRYDQRGTGRSPWHGEHTIALHVRDLLLTLGVTTPCGVGRTLLRYRPGQFLP